MVSTPGKQDRSDSTTLDEEATDTAIEDSFPASDPPSRSSPMQPGTAKKPAPPPADTDR